VHISPDNGHKESSVFVSVYPLRIFQGKWQRVSKAIDDLWTINLKVLYSFLSCAVDFQLVLDCWIYKSLVTDLWAGHPSKGSAQLSSNSKSKFEGSPFRLRLIIMLSLADNSIIFLYFSYVYKYLYIYFVLLAGNPDSGLPWVTSTAYLCIFSFWPGQLIELFIVVAGSLCNSWPCIVVQILGNPAYPAAPRSPCCRTTQTLLLGFIVPLPLGRKWWPKIGTKGSTNPSLIKRKPVIALMLKLKLYCMYEIGLLLKKSYTSLKYFQF